MESVSIRIPMLACMCACSSNGGASASSSGGLAEMIEQYKLLLDFIPLVTRNESGDAIDRVLSIIGNSKDFNFLLTMYEVTLDRLKQMADTERMRFNVQMKLCKTYMEKDDFAKGQEVRMRGEAARETQRERGMTRAGGSGIAAQASEAKVADGCVTDRTLSLHCSAVQVLSQLLQSCQTNGQDDKKNKGSELLEIYALQIQISSKRGDSLKMKELYDKTKDLTAAVKDPRSQSVIRESVGIDAECSLRRAVAICCKCVRRNRNPDVCPLFLLRWAPVFAACAVQVLGSDVRRRRSVAALVRRVLLRFHALPRDRKPREGKTGHSGTGCARLAYGRCGAPRSLRATQHRSLTLSSSCPALLCSPLRRPVPEIRGRCQHAERRRAEPFRRARGQSIPERGRHRRDWRAPGRVRKVRRGCVWKSA